MLRRTGRQRRARPPAGRNAAQDAPMAQPSTPATPSPAPTPTLPTRVLDDDEDFLQYMRSVLEPEGHEVRTVATPTEFFQAAEENLPDVVLLDIKMGHHTGEDVLAEIRKRWERLCVIVVTGYP